MVGAGFLNFEDDSLDSFYYPGESMDAKDLKNRHYYRLTQDVVNAAPDRRKTRDWSAALLIPAGTIFENRYECLYHGYYYVQAGGIKDALFNEILQHLELLPDNVDRVMNRAGVENSGSDTSARATRQRRIVYRA